MEVEVLSVTRASSVDWREGERRAIVCQQKEIGQDEVYDIGVRRPYSRSNRS